MKTSIDYEILEAEIIRKLEEKIDPTSADRVRQVRVILRMHLLSYFRSPSDERLEGSFLHLCKALGEITDLKIEGREHFEITPSIIIGNHLGANKLVKVPVASGAHEFSPERFDFQKNRLKNDDHFMMLFFPFVETIRRACEGRKILPIPILMQYEDLLGLYATSHGFVMTQENGLRRMQAICSQVEKKIEFAITDDAIPYVIIFPEGGTSGKLSSHGPYDLENFYSGFLSLSERFSLKIQPVVCAFSKSFQFFSRIVGYQNTSDEKRALVDYFSKRMQCSLNELVRKIA